MLSECSSRETFWKTLGVVSPKPGSRSCSHPRIRVETAHCAPVHDITIRYNTISHVGNGFQIGNGKTDQGALSAGAWNESIHDIVMDDVDATNYNGGGYLLQESGSDPQLALHDVVINHVTAVGPGVNEHLSLEMT